MQAGMELFRNNTFTITGKLRLMGRRDAYEYVRLCGGLCSRNVTHRTRVLVVGSFEGGRVPPEQIRAREPLHP